METCGCGWIILAGVIAFNLFALAWLAAYWPQDPRKGGW